MIIDDSKSLSTKETKIDENLSNMKEKERQEKEQIVFNNKEKAKSLKHKINDAESLNDYNHTRVRQLSPLRIYKYNEINDKNTTTLTTIEPRYSFGTRNKNKCNRDHDIESQAKRTWSIMALFLKQDKRNLFY